MAARSAWRPMVSASRRASARICSASRARTRPGIAPPGTRRRSRPRHRRAVRGIRHASPVHLVAGGPGPRRGAAHGGGTPGHGRTPGLLSPHPHAGRAAHARRQRLKRAFPGPAAASGEAVRSGGSVSISDQHRRDIGPAVPGTAPGARALRRDRSRRHRNPGAFHRGDRFAAKLAGESSIRPDDRPGRPRMPARRAHRHRQPPGRLHPQGHRRPEDGQRPDRSGPTRRHARDPLRRSKSSGKFVVGARPSPPHRPASPSGSRGPRGSKVLASFTISHERRSAPRAVIRRDVPAAAR